jgi:hypothetical protein
MSATGTTVTPAPAAPASPAPTAAAPAPDPKGAPEGPKQPVTIAASDPPIDEGGDPKSAPPTWPEDWRDQLAGGDEKSLARLKRYGSPQGIMNALFAAQAKISSGELQKGLGKEPTPEEIVAYRKANNIPEKAEEYPLPKGIEFGDEDKPVVDSFLQFAHSKNYTPAMVQEGVTWWNQAQDEVAAKRAESDTAYHTENDDALHAEWGNEYRGNLNTLKNWATKDWPDGLFDNLLGARMANGKLLGDDKSAVKFLVGLAKDIAPSASTTAAGEYAGGAGLIERKAEIEKMMKTPEGLREYQKSDKLKAEYLGIIEQELKMGARAGGKKAA